MRVAKKHDIRRNEILTAAETLFVTKGYEKTTINDILERVEIGKGTFYHYFQSKEEVMNAVIDRTIAGYIEAAEVVIKDEALNASQKFAAIVLGKMEGIPQRQEIIEELHQDGNAVFHQKSLTETILALSPLLAEAVKQGISEGVFDTPYPLETVELLLAASQFLFDRGIFSWTTDDMLRRVEAFMYNTELLLGAEHGSFDYLKAAFSTDGENAIER
jgi:AcrR family transcriptional regulator